MVPALAALLLASSCAKSSDEGTVSFRISEDETIGMVTRSSVSDFAEMPSPDDFRISVITSTEDVIPVEDTSEPTTLPVGSYTARATYGAAEEEGFGKPFFTGEQTFSVASGQASLVWIKTELGNAIIRLEYTESFRKYYTDFKFTVTTGNGTAIDFTPAETRAAFVDAYQIKVKGSLTSQGGRTVSFPEKEYKGLKAATCYTLRFDASNIGSGTISIRFNDIVENVDLGDFELND